MMSKWTIIAHSSSLLVIDEVVPESEEAAEDEPKVLDTVGHVTVGLVTVGQSVQLVLVVPATGKCIILPHFQSFGRILVILLFNK